MDIPCENHLEVLSDLVDSLNKLRRPPEQESSCGPSSVQNAAKIENKIIESEKKFMELKDLVDNKAKYWFLLGRLYNCSSSSRGKALEALCKAVKLDTDSIDAWNELGECYWYHCNVDMARQCFERAIEMKDNKVSIRNLSIVLRKQSLNLESDARKESLEKATNLAKRAVELDPTDGLSWCILGNAFLSEFFNGTHNQHRAVHAIRAYKQAEKSLAPQQNYELYYNKGIALKYIEHFEGALEALSLSAQYEGNWPLPSKSYESLLQYLDSIKLILGKRGKLKHKRYFAMVKNLEHPELGPYTEDSSLKQISIKDLKEGRNSAKLLCGKVIWSLNFDTTFPFTIGIVDVNGDEIVVTIFNLCAYKGFLIGDTLLIPNPSYSVVDVKHLDKVYQFKKVRVNYPPDLVINTKKIPFNFYGVAKFDVSPV